MRKVHSHIELLKMSSLPSHTWALLYTKNIDQHMPSLDVG